MNPYGLIVLVLLQFTQLPDGTLLGPQYETREVFETVEDCQARAKQLVTHVPLGQAGTKLAVGCVVGPGKIWWAP